MVGAVGASSAAAAEPKSAGPTELEVDTGVRLLRRPLPTAREIIRASLGRRVVKLAAIRGGTMQLPAEWITAGVVVRKFDAKAGAKGGAYGVVRLWGFDGLCSESGSTVSLLLAGGVFQHTWSKAFPGDMIAVTSEVVVQRDQPQQQQPQQGGAGPSVLLKATSVGSVFVLGAVEGTKRCGMSTKSGDACTVLTRAAAGGFCSFHASAAVKAAKAQQAAEAARRPVTAVVGPRTMPGKGAAGAAPGLPSSFFGAQYSLPKGPAAPSLAVKKTAQLGFGQARPAKPASSEEFLCVHRGGSGGAVRPDGSTAAKATPVRVGQDAGLDAVERMPLRGDRLTVAALPQAQPNAPAPRPELQSNGQKMLVNALQQQEQRRNELESREAEAAARRARMDRALEDLKRSRSGTAALPSQAPRPQPPAAPVLGGAKGKIPSPASATARPPQAANPLGGFQASALPPSRAAFKPLASSHTAKTLAVAAAPLGVLSKAVSATLAAGRTSAVQAKQVLNPAAQPAQPPKRGTPTPNSTDLQKLSELRSKAAQAKSMHEGLRQQATLAHEERKLDAIAREDAALEALNQVRSVEVTAFHCAQCRKWSYGRPRTCVEQRHSITAGKTTKRYYRCRGCLFSLGILAGNGEPHRVACPRCNASDWADGTAAPGRKQREYDQHGDLVVEPSSGGGDRTFDRETEAAAGGDEAES
jgi:hypothetical protein